MIHPENPHGATFEFLRAHQNQDVLGLQHFDGIGATLHLGKASRQ
jgi:hypothetical protein